MASSTDSSTAIEAEVRQLYERYQAAESDTDLRLSLSEFIRLRGREQRTRQHDCPFRGE